MKVPWNLVFLTGWTIALVAPGQALAQYRHWEISPHAGIMHVDFFEETDQEPLFGLRVTRHFDNGWGVGGNFDYVPGGETIVDHSYPSTDVEMYFYNLEVDYSFGKTGPAFFFVRGGIGAATVKLDTLPEGREPERLFLKESQTDLHIPLGIGFKILNSTTDPWFAFRVDLEDKIANFPRRIKDFRSTEGAKKTTERVVNSWVLTAGLSVLFGGSPRQEIEVCHECAPLPPPPISVEPEPEPEPEPALLCVELAGWFLADETIDVDGRVWLKFGTSQLIPRDELRRVGEFGGFPVYIRHDSPVPFDQIWLPLCSPEAHFQPYSTEPEVRGTTG